MFASEQEVRSLHLFDTDSYEKSRVAAERSSLRQALAERRAERRRAAESRAEARGRAAVARTA